MPQSHCAFYQYSTNGSIISVTEFYLCYTSIFCQFYMDGLCKAVKQQTDIHTYIYIHIKMMKTELFKMHRKLLQVAERPFL